jgi:streptogramin lyase
MRASAPVAAAAFALSLLVVPMTATAVSADGGARAEEVTAGFGAVWATGMNGLIRFDPRDGRITARVSVSPFGSIPTVATGEGSVWMLTRRRIVRIDPAANRVAGAPIHLPATSFAFAAGAGALWVAGYEDGILRKLDPRTGRVLTTIRGVGLHVEAVLATPRAIWVASIGPWTTNSHGEITPVGRGVMSRIDPHTGRVIARVTVGRGPSALAVGAGSVWVVNSRGLHASRSITRVDARSNRATATFALRRLLAGIAVADGYVWVVNPGRILAGGGLDMSGGTLIRISPATGRVLARRLRGSARPAAITVAGGKLWIGSPGNGYVLRVDPKTLQQTRIPIPLS